MQAWLAMKQALTVMDVVTRAWARTLKLDPADVTVILLLHQRPNRGCSELAAYSGRKRQQVHRTLRALGNRGLVEATQFSQEGKAQHWGLTADGRTVAELLVKRMNVWEALIASRVDVSELVRSLQFMVESLVNRPRSEGWIQGLTVPGLVRRDPFWDGPSLGEAVEKEMTTVLASYQHVELEAKTVPAVPPSGDPLELKDNGTSPAGGRGGQRTRTQR